MSTTLRGDQFESDVFALLSRDISEGRFIAPSDRCRIFRKKAYYSKDREKDIVFDIAIEISLPGQATYSSLWLIECKNYGHRVPVDDVEEFFAKTEQIKPGKTYAVVISTNSFQEGAFNFARSKGIGLARYFIAESLHWILTRSPSSLAVRSDASLDSKMAYDGLRQEDYLSRYYDLCCYSGDIYSHSLNALFLKLLRPEEAVEIIGIIGGARERISSGLFLVPFLHAKEIESRCQMLRDAVGYKRGRVSLEAICNYFQETCGLEVREASLASGVLGTISFDTTVIEIDRAQAEGENRARFTLAHELGHLELGHSRYMRRDVCHVADIDLDGFAGIEIKDIVRMEWQANYFAAALLLPQKQLIESMNRIAWKVGVSPRGRSHLYLDHQPCNISDFNRIALPLTDVFGVSRSVIKIRLKGLGLLVEEERSTPYADELASEALRRNRK
jgi:Zn-dependent peptidase ImmA (M78 family)